MKVLKGNIEQAVFVRGDNSGMCAPIINFEGFEKGVYLAFLKSGDNGWYPLDAKMIPLQGDKLMWPETGGGGNVSRQSLNEVQRSINKMLTAKISL